MMTEISGSGVKEGMQVVAGEEGEDDQENSDDDGCRQDEQSVLAETAQGLQAPSAADVGTGTRRTMELIRLEDIYKTYYLGEVEVPVLRGISLSIRRGEMVALMGASGSGKTTLMNILGCLDHATSGGYWLDGQEMSGLSPNQRALVRTEKLGFVFQNFNLLPRTTALQNVAHAAGLFPAADFPARRPPLGADLVGPRRTGRPSRSRAVADVGRTATTRGDRPGAGQSPRACCWPTSRPETSTRTPASKSCGCSSNSMPRGSPSSW